jgi:hypothetical protein
MKLGALNFLMFCPFGLSAVDIIPTGTAGTQQTINRLNSLLANP